MTRTPLKHVALDGAVQVVSSLTGRSVWVNSAMDKFSVMPTFSAAGLARARKESHEALRSNRKGHNHELAVQVIERILSAPDRTAFAKALERAITTAVGMKGQTGKEWFNKLHIGRVLVLCAKHELLLFSPKEMIGTPILRGPSLPEPTAAWCGQARARAMQALDPVLQKRDGSPYTAFRLLLVIGGLQKLGDIGPEVFEILRPVISGEIYQEMLEKRTGGWLPIQYVIEALLTVQREQFGGDNACLERIPRDHVALRFKLEGPPPPSKGNDKTFSWIRAEYQDKAAWQEAAATYLASLDVLDTQGPIGYVNQVLQALFAHTNTPRTPLEFCRIATRKSSIGALRSIILDTDESGALVRSPAMIGSIINHIERFFDLLLETHTVQESGTLDPSYKNPATALRAEAPKVSSRGETDREALPDEVKDELIEALTAPERDPVTGRVVWTFAWAKTLGADRFAWVNPDTKKTEWIWSPARALAILFLLHSPLRGLQLRFLGSGEGDPEVWVPSAQHPRSGTWDEMWAPTPQDVHGGDWVPNTSKWAPPPAHKNAKVQRFTGALRRFPSDDGTEYLGTYVSTNKTADANVNPEKFGYEIPLILPVNLEIVEYLTAWQALYNPATTPKSRTNLHTVPDKGSDKIKGRYPPMHYLFRDAAVQHSNEPITPDRLTRFWELLNQQVDESRKAQGKPPYGLVLRVDREYRKTPRPTAVKYNLHSLRVTAVTEMAENGVPFPVIAAMCGHARWVMSAYYVKLRPEFIRDSLREAQDRKERVRVEADDQEWKESYLQADPLADISLLVGASDVVIPRLQATQRALVKIMDHGFCVFGGARCFDGGPVISLPGERTIRRGPVPGGASNCTACNWFGSGVPWIPPLLSYNNALALDQSLAVERFEAADAAYSALVMEQKTCEARRESFDDERFVKPRRAREQANAIRRDIAERMTSAYKWIGICEGLMARGSDGRPQVVVSSEVRTLLLQGEAATITDQALQTLKDSDVYAFDPTPAATVVGKALSHALSHGGIDFPVLSLSASELASAIAQIEQLATRHHAGLGLRDVFNNLASLESLGIAADVRAFLTGGLVRIPEQELVQIGTRGVARLLPGPEVSTREPSSVT